MLWVICAGAYQGEDGELVQLDPAKSDDEAANSILKTVELHANVSSKAAINKAKDKIFYYKGNSVYVLSTSDTEAPASALLTETQASSFYGIGIDPENDVLYMADSKSFAGNGTVYRYSLSGTAIDDFTAQVWGQIVLSLNNHAREREAKRSTILYGKWPPGFYRGLPFKTRILL